MKRQVLLHGGPYNGRTTMVEDGVDKVELGFAESKLDGENQRLENSKATYYRHKEDANKFICDDWENPYGTRAVVASQDEKFTRGFKIVNRMIIDLRERISALEESEKPTAEDIDLEKHDSNEDASMMTWGICGEPPSRTVKDMLDRHGRSLNALRRDFETLWNRKRHWWQRRS